jgi:hypothetical protein
VRGNVAAFFGKFYLSSADALECLASADIAKGIVAHESGTALLQVFNVFARFFLLFFTGLVCATF